MRASFATCLASCGHCRPHDAAGIARAAATNRSRQASHPAKLPQSMVRNTRTMVFGVAFFVSYQPVCFARAGNDVHLSITGLGSAPARCHEPDRLKSHRLHSVQPAGRRRLYVAVCP